ncbi:MAG: adenylate kinase family protein [Vulcanisaeta sp.]|jgi:adenylate kinase|uniref:adenylate kinase family protein n=1 Tax=Vulcanisaeta sp. TaxID=2020871 RepID=UPI003D0E16D1
MVRLLVTGSPGVGKTTIAIELSKIYNAPLIDVDEVIKPLLRWDDRLQTNYIIDETKARDLIMRKLSNLELFIIDTTAVNLIDRSLVDWCIVLRLNPIQLMQRLLMRGWPRCKVIENVLAEIVGSSLSMAIDTFGKDRIIEVDTTNKGVGEVVRYIVDHVSNGIPNVGVVDWFDTLNTDLLISLSEEMDKCLT